MSSSPAAVMVTNSELPPAEKNGSVKPVTGIIPVTPPTLMMVCTTSQTTMPPASRLCEAVVRRQRDLHAGVGQHQEAAEHRDDTDQPELLGDDGEDEVAVGERQESPSLRLAAGRHPRPPEPPCAMPIIAWYIW